MKISPKKRLLLVAAVGSACFALPAPAQTATPPSPTAVTAPAPVDPARFAAAQSVVNKVFPAGTYRKMMGGSMDKMMSAMADRMLDIPVADLARMAGLSEDKLGGLKPATTRQMMKILDPYFDQRVHLSMDAMMGSMVDLMDTMEPDVRAGVTEAYAAHFTTAELIDLDRFFTTPVGAHYASQSMLVYLDPAVLDRMGQMVPKMMAMMPNIMKKVQAATASLPPAPKAGKLTDKQKADLAALLGEEPQPGKQGQ